MVFICFPFASVLAQNTQIVNLKIVDSINNEPLYGATVSTVKHRHAHISDAQGLVQIDSLPLGDLVLHVSYVGYHHLDLKIHLPASSVYLVLLCSETQHLHESVISGEGSSLGFTGREKAYLGSEEIGKHQSQNLGDLLKNLNGVTLLSSAGGISKPVVRGLQGQRLVTLQGNTRLEAQQWGDDHGPEIDPFMANGVELIKGAATLEYGPEAIGGAIKIIPKPWRKENGIEGQLNLQGFSNNKQGASSLAVEGRSGKELYVAWRTQASFRKAGDSHAPEYNISNTGFDENSISAKFAIGKKKWIWENSLSRYATTRGIFVGSHMGNISDLNQALSASKPLIILPFTYQIGRPFQEVQHVLFSSELSLQVTQKTRVKILYSQQVNRRKEYDADRVYNQALQGKPAMDLEIQSFIGEQHLEHKFKNHWAYKIGTTQTLQQNTVQGLQFIIPAFQSLTLGSFVILKREWLMADLSFGIRYDMRWLEVPEFVRYQKKYSYSKMFKGKTVGLTYTKKFEHEFKTSISFQTGWRPPAVNELYSYGLHYGVASFEIGDSNLLPERSYMLEVNVSKAFGDVHFEVSGFVQKFQDFIYKSPLAEPILTIRGAFPAFQFTQTNAILFGGEASFGLPLSNQFNWFSKVSYLYAQNTRLNQPLLWMPANRMEHSLTYNFALGKKIKGANAELQSVWVAKQNRYIAGVDYVNPPEGYVLFNARVGIQFKPYVKARYWDLQLSAQNLFNHSYRDYQSRFRYFTNDPGFNLMIQLRVPF